MKKENKQSEWEKEFNEKFVDYLIGESNPNDRFSEIKSRTNAEKVKSFIRNLLAAKEKEARQKGYEQGRLRCLQQHYGKELENALKQKEKEAISNYLKSEEGKVYLDYQELKKMSEKEAYEKGLNDGKKMLE